jgi:hypothetical protein
LLLVINHDSVVLAGVRIPASAVMRLIVISKESLPAQQTSHDPAMVAAGAYTGGLLGALVGLAVDSAWSRIFHGANDKAQLVQITWEDRGTLWQALLEPPHGKFMPFLDQLESVTGLSRVDSRAEQERVSKAILAPEFTPFQLDRQVLVAGVVSGEFRVFSG